MNKKIIFLFSIIFLLSFISATFSCDDFTSKWDYCGKMNISGVDCDNFWMNASDCNQNKTTTCIFNESNFYSREQIDIIFGNLTSFINSTNGTIIFSFPNVNQSLNLTGYITREELNNATQILWDDSLENFVSNTTYEGLLYEIKFYNNKGDESNFDFNPLWLIFAVLVIIGCAWCYKEIKNKKVQAPTQIPNSAESSGDLKKIIEVLSKKDNQNINSRKRK